jgi:integrase
VPRQIGKLSPAKVRSETKPGIYGDGGGLWLNVSTAGTKSWLYRYMLNGKAREMGLGPLHTIGLAEARERARAARHLCLDGIDPIDAKHTDRENKRLAAASAVTFQAAAHAYIAANKAGWRNAKHAAQWDSTLAAYVYPTIGALPVGEINTGHVTKVLEPIWSEKTETASRVRGRIEAVLDFAKVHRWRSGENPARWKGHIENVLPKRSKVRAVVHHAALPWTEIGALMDRLAEQVSVAALALRFTILTASRSGEALGARWSEIDQQYAVWTVPAERMKAGREHRVPLSNAALAVLCEAATLSDGMGDVFVFPGRKAGLPLSNQSLRDVLHRMSRGDLTPHGFRSTFRDWASETGQPADIAEAALAHTLGTKTVLAYQRGDLLERRRRQMEGWARFCAGQGGGGEVVTLRPAQG